MPLKYIFPLFFLILVSACNTPKQALKVIKELDNNQFVIDPNQKANFNITGNTGMKLIKKGPKINKQLYESLTDSTKTIMLHWVLSQINYGKVTFAGPKESTVDNSTYLKYFLGEEGGEGLIITGIKTNGEIKTSVTKADRDKIIEYWKTRLRGYLY